MKASRKADLRVGLIVNPLAGIGGKVGLKGSDGAAIQEAALERGAVPEAASRAAMALERLRDLREEVALVTYPGEMGEEAARASGFEPEVFGSIEKGGTTAADTRKAAREMLRLGVRLLLFAGGDGTARDIFDEVGGRLPALGIPAGVKIHSAAFATNPGSAGDLARLFLTGTSVTLREAEIMDIDEDALRRGIVAAKLWGYLRVPHRSGLVQNLKSGSSPSETSSTMEIAEAVVQRMADDRLYIVGPGTTTRAIAERLGLGKTLIGVDAVTKRSVVAADANERRILQLLGLFEASIIVTPVGGQGFILGRGNQPISADVIRRVGRDNLWIVSTVHKLQSLHGRPLLVDTGDPGLDRELSGYRRVITGYRQETVYRVSG